MEIRQYISKNLERGKVDFAIWIDKDATTDATMLYYTMDEAQEGGKAFLEKRKPRFEDYPQFP